MSETLLFDTYAIIEIIKGNQNYLKYVSSQILLNEFILSELCYILIKLYGIEIAYNYVDEYAEFVVNVDKEIIKEAMNLKYTNRKNKLSMTDCIGYIQAKKIKVKFLTGDKEFEKMSNVEFQK